MNIKHKQYGASMLSILMILSISALFLMTAFKVIPVYIEAANIKTAINNLEDRPGLTKMSKKKIKSTLEQSLRMNGQRDVDLSGLEVANEAGRIIISLSYDKRVPWIQNIDLMLHFDNEYVAVKH